MTTIDDLRQTFFEESAEGLEAIDSGLNELSGSVNPMRPSTRSFAPSTQLRAEPAFSDLTVWSISRMSSRPCWIGFATATLRPHLRWSKSCRKPTTRCLIW